MAAFPEAFSGAPTSGGSAGSSSTSQAPDAVIRDTVTSAWARTAPRKVAEAYAAARPRAGSMTVAEPPLPPARTSTAGARRIGDAFARARADGRAALIPYVVAGYPDADGSLAAALAAIDAGADLLEVGLPYSDPLADGATLQRASGAALAAGATFASSLAPRRAASPRAPAMPLVPMGYANQLIGAATAGPSRGRWWRPARPASSSPTSRRTRVAPFEAVAAEAGLAVVYLVAPTTVARPRARWSRRGAAGSCTACRSSG